jgi:hypothetical protein
MWIVTVDAIVGAGRLAAVLKLVVIMTGSAFAVRKESDLADLWIFDHWGVELAIGCPRLMTCHAVALFDELVHEFRVGERHVAARTHAIGFCAWWGRSGRHCRESGHKDQYPVERDSQKIHEISLSARTCSALAQERSDPSRGAGLRPRAQRQKGPTCREVDPLLVHVTV